LALSHYPYSLKKISAAAATEAWMCLFFLFVNYGGTNNYRTDWWKNSGNSTESGEGIPWEPYEHGSIKNGSYERFIKTKYGNI